MPRTARPVPKREHATTTARATAGDATGTTGTRARHIADSLDAIRRLTRVLRVAARQAEDGSGLSPAQLYVLGQIGARPDRSLSELAAQTLTDRTSVAAMADRLIARGLVTSRRGAADRRRLELRLTAAGARVLKRGPGSPTEHLLDALEGLDTAALARLAASLDDLVRALGADGEPPSMLFEDTPNRAPRRQPRHAGD